MGSMGGSENPPRWVGDPTGRHELRYWDGTGWTGHVADGGVETWDPPFHGSAEQPARSLPTPTRRARSRARRGGRFKRWPRSAKIGVPVAAVVGGMIVVGAISGGEDSPTVATQARSSTATTTVQHVATVPSTTTRPTVPPTTRLPIVATIPPTVAPTAPPTIAPTTPPAPPQVAAPPPPSSNCHPNYGGCVPNDPVDVDCAGGSGNGPSYVRGPIQVIGADVYGLDADHDGIACE